MKSYAPTISYGNYLQFLAGGEKYFTALFHLIDEAKHKIHLQTYILEDDAIGLLTIQKLIQASERGVEVFLMLDAFGSHLKDETISLLKTGKINFRYFGTQTAFFNFKIGRRMHHKIMVQDAENAIVTGNNIANRYHPSFSSAAWLDFAVIISGDAAKKLSEYCEAIWQKEFFEHFFFKKKEKYDREGLLKINVNDFLRHKKDISISFLKAFRQAKENITLVSSYFLPKTNIIYELIKSKKRGVDVEIILSSKSDVRLVQHATRLLYRVLLHNHIRIFEWTPSVLHGKLVVVDGDWSSLGSYNFNLLSQYLSLELNIESYSSVFNQSIRQELTDIKKQNCVEISVHDFEKKYNIWHYFADVFAYFTLRIIFLLLYKFSYSFYKKQTNAEKRFSYSE